MKDKILSVLTNDVLSFRNYLDVIKTKVYPSKRICELIENELIDIVDFMLNKIREASGGITTEVFLINEIWSSNHIQHIAHSINNAESKFYPFEIVNVYKDMIIDIEDMNVEVATVPEDVFSNNGLNFSFTPLWKIIDEIIISLGKIGYSSQHTNPRLIRLAYPKEFKNDIFIAGIYSHEIGHYFDISNDYSTKLIMSSGKIDAFKTDLTPFLFKKEMNKWVNISSSEYLFAVLDIIKPWIQEIFADLTGVSLLGPAFLLSNLEFHMHHNLLRTFALRNTHRNEPLSMSHPFWQLRMKVQAEHLHKNIGIDVLNSDLKDAFEKLYQYFDGFGKAYHSNEYYISTTKRYSIKVNDLSLKLFENLVLSHIDELCKKVSEITKKNEYTSELWQLSISLADSRISQLIPPCELDDNELTPATIINSAWIARLVYEDDLLGKIAEDGIDGKYELLRVINDLTLFGLNGARTYKRWNKNVTTE